MQNWADKQPWFAAPPLIIAVPFMLGMVLQWVFPIRFPPRWIGVTLGALCSLPAAGLLVSALITFRRARTSMFYLRLSRTLIVDGPFRFTRNPLFVGLMLVYAGVCFATGTPWPLLFLPVVIALLHWVVIVPEERSLEDQFGDEYRAYRTHVRRWL